VKSPAGVESRVAKNRITTAYGTAVSTDARTAQGRSTVRPAAGMTESPAKRRCAGAAGRPASSGGGAVRHHQRDAEDGHRGHCEHRNAHPPVPTITTSSVSISVCFGIASPRRSNSTIRGYSALIPARLTTSAHFAISDLTNGSISLSAIAEG